MGGAHYSKGSFPGDAENRRVVVPDEAEVGVGGHWVAKMELPPLAPDEVQLWRIDLDTTRPGTRAYLDEAYAVLTEYEKQRAARMRAGLPRDEFVAGRGSLRRLLGAAVGAAPETLVLEKGTHGKPRLKDGVWFNVAHSRGVILIGLSMTGEIGVDVEYREPMLDLKDVARTAFHDDELARLEGAGSADLRLAEFYRCWTRKEAVLKADGRGLTIEPKSFPVGPDIGVEVEVSLPAKVGGQRYFVREVHGGQYHAAAVACAQSGLAIRLYEISAKFWGIRRGSTGE